MKLRILRWMVPITFAFASAVASAPAHADPGGCTGYQRDTEWGHTGWFLCDTLMPVRWADGHYEVFGIGTNHAVWHITAWTNGWKSMGGWADTTMGYSDRGPGTHAPTIWVANQHAQRPGYQWWCTSYMKGKWIPWYRCPSGV